MKKTLLLFSFLVISAAEAQTMSTVLAGTNTGIGQSLHPSGIAIHDNFLYAGTGMNANIIYKVDLSQSNTSPSIFISGLGKITDICFRGNYLYASEYNHPNPNRIIRIDVSQPNPVVENVVEMYLPTGLTIYNQYLYARSKNNIFRINLDMPGQEPEVIASDLIGSGTVGLAVIGNYLFVSEREQGKLVKYSLVTPNPTKIVVATGLSSISGIVKGETNNIIYAAIGSSSGEIYRVNTTNGTYTLFVTTPLTMNWDMLYTDNKLYVSDIEGNEVIKIGVNALSVDDVEASKIKAYPVPSSDIVNFENCTFLGLTDVRGKQIDIKSNNAQIDIAPLPSGIYIAKIEAEGKTSYKKIVKN